MKIIFITLVLLTVVANANWTDTIFDKSTKIGNDALKESKQIYNKTKDTIVEYTSDKKLTNEELKHQRFNEIWAKVHKKLSEGSSLFEKKNASPDSVWFGTDKESVQVEIDEVLNKIIEILVGDDLLKYKNQIAEINERITSSQINISEYRNKRVAAPSDSSIHTTKKQYKNKIKETKNEIQILKHEIKLIQNKLKINLNNIGVILSTKQIEILLTRIDGDDIIQISLVMDVLKQITNQIMLLMKESNEELSEAKKYYGMHLISLELVVYIQQKYINKVGNIYIPKIDKIIKTSKQLINDTKKMVSNEKDKKRKSIYLTNKKAQKLTLDVAKIYKADLKESKNNMIRVQNISKENLKLANNIYSTVLLSSDLYSLISDSQTMFSTITKIQIPNIVPFKNIQIQQKYKELTKTLGKDN